MIILKNNIDKILKIIGWGFVGFLFINLIIKTIQIISLDQITENLLLPEYLYPYTISLEIFQLLILCSMISLCIFGIIRKKTFIIPIVIIAYLFIPQMTLLFDRLLNHLFLSN